MDTIEKGDTDTENEITYEQLFSYVGNFGKGQIIWVIFCSYLGLIDGYSSIAVVFSAYEFNFKCKGTDSFDSQCSNSSGQCVEFDYELTDNFQDSLVTEFDLVCNQQYWVTLCNIAFFVLFFDGPVAGYVCDNYGRKTAMLIGTTSAMVFSFLMWFVTEIWQYFMLKMLLGVSSCFSFAIS